MKFIWATRGKTWGFRFLADAGLADPLPVYEQAFAGAGSASELCKQLPQYTVLRFPDPLGRKDSAGRVIPHEFVLFADAAAQVSSVELGLELVWTEVSEQYADIWE